jgi:hypothetical protein
MVSTHVTRTPGYQSATISHHSGMAWIGASRGVGSIIGGLAEVVVTGRTGLLVDGGPERACTHLRPSARTPWYGRATSKVANQRAQEQFGFDRQVDAYGGLNQMLAEEAGHDADTGETHAEKSTGRR